MSPALDTGGLGVHCHLQDRGSGQPQWTTESSFLARVLVRHVSSISPIYNHGLHTGDLGTSVLEFDSLGDTFTEVGHISQDHGTYFAVSVIEFSDYLEWCMP